MTTLAPTLDAAPSLDTILAATRQVKGTTAAKIDEIHKITNGLRMLALNALIESARAGENGRGFSVVAAEVREISSRVGAIAQQFSTELSHQMDGLESMTLAMSTQAAGQRLMDLALNAIELMDRNLYERTCDVRWWATDSAVVDALGDPSNESLSHASRRLGVILGAYTVYLDIWLCDREGRVVASGRPDRFPIAGQSVRQEPWFAKSMALATGDDYAVADVTRAQFLQGAEVATYATAVRAGGATHGAPLGVLAVHFDWEPQARAIVQGVRLSEEEAGRSRVMLVDARKRVIASSDGRGVLGETIAFDTAGRRSGVVQGADGTTTAFHLTPGYETYGGLGWYGVIQQKKG
ncbi:MAG: chemotaxis sensory transducer protein [Xanthobacteraceae bacterium]|nr:MAG: chemotaxis sensory transducer protein [Xanthobacteraceae bacterium]